MNIIEQMLQELSNETPNNENLITLANQAKGVFSQLKSDSQTNLQKFEDAKTTRDKAKTQLAQVRKSLGITEEGALTAELLAKYVNRSEDVKTIEEKYVNQLAQVAEERETERNALQSEIATKNAEIQNMQVDVAISKISDSYNSVDGANLDVINNLKENATISDDGTLIYVDSNGKPIINNNGVTMGLKDKLESLKESKPFLFKAQTQETAGQPNSNAQGLLGGTPPTSDFGKIMEQRVKQAGYTGK